MAEARSNSRTLMAIGGKSLVPMTHCSLLIVKAVPSTQNKMENKG